ncbi:YfhO family protein [Paenibacillus lautus]|uniref:YfhO family protein n=1 Tax=Paenibacillus lautus TaxID=1401 RepID=UPI003D2C4931
MIGLFLILLLIYNKLWTGELWLKWDVYDAAFPLGTSISAALKHGELPLWEPFVFRGVPLSHLIGVSVWSPISIILGLIGYSQYLMQIQYLIFVLLAGFFMYLSLNIKVKNRWLCMVGGIAYATSGEIISNAQHVTFLFALALFPCLHYAFRKWIITQKLNWCILMGSIVGLLVLNNYPTFVIFSVLFIFIEFVFELKSLKIGRSFKQLIIQLTKALSITLGIALCVGFVSIYTTLEIMNQITRDELSWEAATASSLDIWNWFGVLSPALTQVLHNSLMNLDPSMGNVYVALPLFVFAFVIVKRKYDFFSIGMIIFSILISLGDNGFIYRLLYEVIPGVSTFRFPAGLRYFYFYYLILFAIYNVSRVNTIKQEEKEKGNIARNILFVFTAIIGILMMNMMIFRVLQIQTIAVPRNTITELLLALGFLLITSVFLSRNKKMFATVTVCIFTIIFSYLNVERNAEFTLGTSVRPSSYQNEIDTFYSTKEINLNNQFVEPLFNSMGPPFYNRDFQTGGYIGSFELNTFRAANMKGLIPLQEQPVLWAVESRVVKLDYGNLGESIILPHSLKYTPNNFYSDIDMTSPGFVVLEQNYFNGWEAKVNGLPAEIQRLESGAMAIQVNDGNNKVEFSFKPKGTIISAWISFISWFGIMIYGLTVFILRKKQG